MEGILLDNWYIEDLVSSDLKKKEGVYEKKYIDLLEAIVLWDNLYYPDNEYSTWWKHIGEGHDISKVLQPLDDNGEEMKKEADDILKSIPNGNVYTDSVAKGAVRYALLSNIYGLNYLPCEERGMFIKQIELQKYFEFQNNVNSSGKTIDRHDMMEFFDGKILEYYSELYKQFGKTIFDFKLPILADYIIHTTPKDRTNIERACELRNNPQIIAYRKYMKEVEEAFNHGQWDKISEFQSKTEQLVQEIYERKGFIHSITASLHIWPSFSFNLSVDTGKMVKILSTRRVQFNFLRKLGEFSYQGRELQ